MLPPLPVLDNALAATLCAAAAGVSLHLGLFIRGEWERHVPTLAAIQAAGPVLLWASLVGLGGLGLSHAALATALLAALLYAGLFGSVTVYRAFFHPLRRFPGPAAARLSGFWSIRRSIPDCKWHLEAQHLHRQYGDFVRLRPREISINKADAVQDVHGPNTKCVKGPFYDINYPARSLQMTRDKKYHAQRRRHWDRAFSTRALKDYEKRLQGLCNDMCSRIATFDSKPSNATDLCERFGFDVMGDLIFGKSFNMLKSPEDHFLLKQFREGKPFAVLLGAPWVFRALQTLPIVWTIRTKWIAWCAKQLAERLATPPNNPDLFTHIVAGGDDKASNKQVILDNLDLTYDAELAIVAGSDTTASALAAALFLLAKYPSEQLKLKQELDDVLKSTGGLSHQALAGKQQLDGVINEALRLYPPVPSGVQRMTPPEGAAIAGRWIPGDTIVTTPTHTLHRDPRNFLQPDEFIPERWSSRPSLVKHKEAFIPFSTGVFSCAGKPLAIMELRLALSQIMSRFEIKFENAAESIQLFEDKPGWQDCFTARVPPVQAVFVERAKGE